MALSATVLISLLVSLSGGLSSGSASAAINTSGSANIEYSANILPSLNVTIPVSTVSLTLNPVNASLATSNVPITVGTNNDYGYTLILSSTNNITALTRTEELPDHTIPTIDTLTTTEDGYTAEEFTVNRWGYSINNGNYNGYTSGVMLGSSNTRVNADVTNVNFAAKADYTTSAGTYNLGLTFNVVATPATYTIEYANDSGDASVTGSPINPAAISTGTSSTGIVLSSDVPTRSGYIFVGWCNTATTNSGTTCNGTTYEPGTNYTIQDTDDLIITLNAVWKVKTYIQDVTTANCPTEMTLVYDKRDEQEYNIQKLADNNCWLLDNLRLGAESLTESLSTSNTNMSPSVSFALPTSISEGFNSYTGAQINTDSANTVASTTYGSASGKIGVYYNYCAASAGTYCYASDSGTGNASYDICPSGWRMPTGGSSGKYQALYTAYSSDATNFRNALSTPLSGYYDGSSAYDQGSGGYFWSSTYYYSGSMYVLYVTSSDVYPRGIGNRSNGFSVRCVAK